ncbi:hypothetical protein NicSoilB4_10990 [Arthrobacter sp. NicSoilB4]|uniref:hypothetical protein n=1 Tax=Arthrobacter sp. NicSoilB4 TaxID=2830997 RepID=UPI001CC60AC6|nr:hypothetical protein [Arthrobacter sp. NicSoilB4]BCW66336.1 hypothetical protein NicSoilB4_10990 [Arthrobacter sp. NicSoilB4]
MNNLFFWIIILSFLIPMAMRYYKKSMRGRNQNQDMPGGPDQFGQFPGGQSGYGPGPYPGPQNKQPRDGMTQRDYFGAFGELGAPQRPMPPANQQYPGQPYPNQQYPAQHPVPYEDSPDYPGNQPRPIPQQDAQQFGAPQASTPPASGPSAPPPPSAPQGFRARKLAELDQKYSNGELAMEDYMAQRAEIMKG